MRILIDIVHPAHVHFYRAIGQALEERGHQLLWIARDKDLTHVLLSDAGIAFETSGVANKGSRGAQLHELIARVAFLQSRGRQFGADLILTRNPAGTLAARLLRIPSIFDTDDGRAAGVHFLAAAPFATLITTPASLRDDFGPKHRKYPGFKQSAYLHPDLFTPDPGVRQALGLSPAQPFFLVRFVAMMAAHDHGEAGLDVTLKRHIIERLQRVGRVFVSAEGPMPDEWLPLRFPLPASRMHDALAFADMLIGDSQTMAAEAAMLGTPNLRCSSFARKLDYLRELEERYQLTRSFLPNEADTLLTEMEAMLNASDIRMRHTSQRALMLSQTINIVDWYAALVEETIQRPQH